MKKLLPILVLLPLYLFAQTTGVRATNDYDCCSHSPNPCMRVLDTDEAAHNCTYHGVGCNSSGSAANTRGFNITSPTGSGIVGSLTGLLAGSFLYDPKGENQAGTGAALGYGIFSAIHIFTDKKERSVGTNIANGFLTGAALGYAAGKIQMSYAEPSTTTTTEPPKDNTVLYAGAGAVGGAILNTVFRKKTKGGYTTYEIRKKRYISDMLCTISGNKIGVIVMF